MFTVDFYDKQQCKVAKHEIDCITNEAAAFTARLETYNNRRNGYETFVVRSQFGKIIASGSWLCNSIKMY